MKRNSVLAVAMALVVGLSAFVYACGNSAKSDQASTNSGLSCAAKTSQVSAGDKSPEAKALTADSKVKSGNEMSSACGSSCASMAKGASTCPYMKENSSVKQTKATQIDKQSKEKAQKAKTVEAKSANTPLAANQE